MPHRSGPEKYEHSNIAQEGADHMEVTLPVVVGGGGGA